MNSFSMEKEDKLKIKYQDLFTKMNISYKGWFFDISKCSMNKEKSKIVINDDLFIFLIDTNFDNSYSIIVKTFDDENLILDKNIPYFRDFQILEYLNRQYLCPSILFLIGFSPIDFNGKHSPVIITEQISNGSLYDFLQLQKSKNTQNQRWDLAAKTIIIYGIASAMMKLHQKKNYP